MARVIFIALLVFVGVCAVMAQISYPCGKNEFWNDCGSACREAKCGQDNPPVCPLYCQARCECVSGYCRNKAGKCVPNPS